MKYVLSDVAGENYRRADGYWSEDIDDAERFDHDAAVIRKEELEAEECYTKIVETHGRKRHRSESMLMRTTAVLAKLEEAWKEKTIGIGYECDTASGRMTITFEPEGCPELAIQISTDVANVCVGEGDEN